MARASLRLVLSIPPSTVLLSGALLTPGSIRLRTTAWRILGETRGAGMNQRTRQTATNNVILNCGHHFSRWNVIGPRRQCLYR
jgi:hypothetical protein